MVYLSFPLSYRFILIRFRLTKLAFLILVTTLCLSNTLLAAELKLAVASNFANTAEALIDNFERRFSHTVSLSRGSSGKHYAQIKNGAPFDIFLSANKDFPQRLESEGIAVEGSRFTYAIGSLVLIAQPNISLDYYDVALARDNYDYLAIANPKLSPYGYAAKEFLVNSHLWFGIQNKLVIGENINQAALFVKLGEAELGLLALSQINLLKRKYPEQTSKLNYLIIPKYLYTPIEQQAVVTKSSQASQEFMQYLASEEARAIILDHGYGLPHAQ